MKKGLRPIMLINVEGIEGVKKNINNEMFFERIHSSREEFKEKCGFDPVDGNFSIDINYGECDDTCSTTLCRDDLEDIISDLQEEYYRLSAGKDIVLKIQIADLIDRLCRLLKTMEE